MNNYYTEYFVPKNPDFKDKLIWFDYTWGQMVLERNDTTQDSYTKSPHALMHIGNMRILFENGHLWEDTGDDKYLDNICERFLLNNASYT